MLNENKNYKRTDYCAQLSELDIGNEVVVCGWVDGKRNLGNLIFVNLKDRTGIVQLVFNEGTDEDVFSKALSLRSQYVVLARGVVRKRSSVNKKLKTGTIEILVDYIDVLATSDVLPFEIDDDTTASEALKLKYRYLDLRRPVLQKNIMLRHRIVKFSRDFFSDNGFLEIETPMLIKSTPEGARDYLVPSRIFNGKFFALPQSPQLYKQLLMISGFDRYFQVARCFRDEDLRADRQPEFTQLDIEMSFIDSNDVMALMENFIKGLFREILSTEVPTPFERLTYNEAMKIYGSDKPDTRYDLKIKNLNAILVDTNFKVFSEAVACGGAVLGINAKNLASEISRKKIDALNNWMKENTRLSCFSWAKVQEDGTASSSYEKNLRENEAKMIRENLELKNGDIAFIVASKDKLVAQETLGALRVKIAADYNLADKSKFNFLWVTDFPLLEYSEEEKRYIAKHHPFTSPKKEDLKKLDGNPAEVLSDAYDCVLNGFELGGGSIRINDVGLQNKMFNLLGFSKEEVENRFGFLTEAFKYGVPPHGGMAIGLDRLCMLMLECRNIREVIAFPKVQSSADPMSEAPSDVSITQLKELGLSIK